jgi:hypothetical protein
MESFSRKCALTGGASFRLGNPLDECPMMLDELCNAGAEGWGAFDHARMVALANSGAGGFPIL